jgi:predicted PurR-regulated permease PerM
MIELNSTTRRNFALAALGLLVLWFAWEIRAVLNPLLLGYLCAHIVHPLVERLVERGLSRRSAVNLVFLLGFLSVVAAGFGLWQQGSTLVGEITSNPDLASNVQKEIVSAHASAQAFVDRHVPGVKLPGLDELAVWLRDALAQLVSSSQAGPAADGAAAAPAAAPAGAGRAEFASNTVRGFFGGLLAFTGLLVLVPLYTYFLLFELERVHKFVRRYLPRTQRARISRVAEEVGEMLSTFFRGRMLVCALKGAFITIGLLVCDVPYAFLFGMGSGFLSLIPFVGALVGFLAALLVAMVDQGALPALLKTGIVFGVAEILEGYVLIPKILGDSLGLHPVVVLFAIMAGGAALGFFGVLIALPLTATLVILVREFVLPPLARFADEAGSLPPPAPPNAPRKSRG